MSRKQRYYMRGVGVGILVCALILIISRINTPAHISDEEIISRARALGMVDPGDLSLSEADGLGGSDATSGTGANDANSDQNANAGDADAAGNTGDQNANATGTDATGTADDQSANAGNTNATDTTGEQNANATGTDTTGTADGQNANSGDTDAAGITGDQNANADDTDAAGTTADQNADAGNTDVADTIGDQSADAADTDAVDTTGNQSGETVPDGNSYAVLVVERGNSSDVVAARLQSLGVITDWKDFDKYLVNNGYASRISVGTFQIPYGSGYEYIAKVITRSL